MEQPGYTDITQIVKLHDLVEVYNRLAHGWRLLSVRTGGTADAQQTIYIPGLPRPGSVDTSPSAPDSTACVDSGQHLA